MLRLGWYSNNQIRNVDRPYCFYTSIFFYCPDFFGSYIEKSIFLLDPQIGLMTSRCFLLDVHIFCYCMSVFYFVDVWTFWEPQDIFLIFVTSFWIVFQPIETVDCRCRPIKTPVIPSALGGKADHANKKSFYLDPPFFVPDIHKQMLKDL